MRFKSSFSLYKRKVGRGKIVFYYRCYDKNGNRVCGHSTGQTSKTAAREYCMFLLKENRLVREKYQKMPTFKEFADGFWDSKKSDYLKYLASRKPISKTYPDLAGKITASHLLDKFGQLRLEAITSQMIDSWLLAFPAKGLSPATGNLAFRFLSVMLSWAVRKELIKANPCRNVKLLRVEEKKRELLEHTEVKKLFGEEWETYWGKYLYCLVNKLAACTGMRIGEVMGLRGEYITAKHIIVNGQYNKYGYTDTKNHKSRTIPIPDKVMEELNKQKEVNGNGYLFSLDGGKTPIGRKAISDALTRALTKLGIDKAEQKERGLSFHSWRHFFNTSLLLADVPDVKIREMTGHMSRAMTEKYTHLKIADLKEITSVQEDMLNV